MIQDRSGSSSCSSSRHGWDEAQSHGLVWCLFMVVVQECKSPERDLPIGTLASLAICTTLYMAVSLVATGILPYYK